METTIRRKQTAFRLNEKLLEDLKEQAVRCNRSLNNLVEIMLTEALYEVPNQETMEAIHETRAGKYAGTLDLSSFENFMGSIDKA